MSNNVGEYTVSRLPYGLQNGEKWIYLKPFTLDNMSDNMRCKLNVQKDPEYDVKPINKHDFSFSADFRRKFIHNIERNILNLIINLNFFPYNCMQKLILFKKWQYVIRGI